MARIPVALLFVIVLFSVSTAIGNSPDDKKGKSAAAVVEKKVVGTAKETALPPGAGFPAFEPKINKKGELLIPSGFTPGEGPSGLGKHWVIGNGQWEIRDGAVTAIKAPDGDHSAGLRSDIGQLPNQFILEFKFRFEPDHQNADGKHKLNLRVMGNGKALVMHPTRDQLVLRNMAEGGGSVVHVEKKVNLKVGKWYSVMVEIRDEDCCVQMSDVGQFEFSHDQIKKRKKKFFVFNIGKARSSVKDVRFWATP